MEYAYSNERAQKAIVSCLVILIIIYFASIGFSYQVAYTLNGKAVALEDNGTWKYIEINEGTKIELITKQVYDELHFWFYNDPERFSRVFGITWDPYHDSFDSSFGKIMAGFKECREGYSDNWLYSNMVKQFDRETAENIMYILDHWQEWGKLYIYKQK